MSQHEERLKAWFQHQLAQQLAAERNLLQQQMAQQMAAERDAHTRQLDHIKTLNIKLNERVKTLQNALKHAYIREQT
jgi:hypothetical protein